jgi:hypothetical protein
VQDTALAAGHLLFVRDQALLALAVESTTGES